MSQAKRLLPLFNRILIRKPEPPKQSKGGIVIPEDSKEKVRKGTVVAVGPGIYRDGRTVPCSLRVGDEVLLPEYGGTKVDMESAQNDSYYLYKELDILAKVETH